MVSGYPIFSAVRPNHNHVRQAFQPDRISLERLTYESSHADIRVRDDGGDQYALSRRKVQT
jgi:hypothetical protein